MTGDEMKDLRTAIERLASQVESLESRLESATGIRRPGRSAPARKRSATTKRAGTTKSSSTKTKRTTARKRPAKTKGVDQHELAQRAVAAVGQAHGLDRPFALRLRASLSQPLADGPPCPDHRRLRLLGDGAGASARTRSPSSSTSPASTCARRRPTSRGRSSSARTSATRCSRSSFRRPRWTPSSTATCCSCPSPGRRRQQLHDINVIGSLQLLAACEKTESVRTIVVRGSTAIYGAEPNAPAVLHRGHGAAVSLPDAVPARRR